MQSMPILGGSGGMPPRKFWKITLSEIESIALNAPVDTGIQNVLNIALLPARAYIHAVIQLLFIYIFVLLPAIVINAIVNDLI